MAEEPGVTYDPYRADVAVFRADMACLREAIRVAMANLEQVRSDILALRDHLFKPRWMLSHSSP